MVHVLIKVLEELPDGASTLSISFLQISNEQYLADLASPTSADEKQIPMNNGPNEQPTKIDILDNESALQEKNDSGKMASVLRQMEENMKGGKVKGDLIFTLEMSSDVNKYQSRRFQMFAYEKAAANMGN